MSRPCHSRAVENDCQRRRPTRPPFFPPQILEMAGENEIDSSLILLLEQNIAGARGAGQEDAAVFMEKVKAACTKYVLK